MVGRQLNAQPRFAIDVDTVPIVLRVDRATQQSGPESALGGQVGGVENNDLSGNPHPVILPWTAGNAGASPPPVLVPRLPSG